MKEFYEAIYLSPHLDDVALSCGGQIFDLTRKGKPVLIVTLMAGNPASTLPSQYAQSLHQRWQLDNEAVQTRRAEDIAACKILGADWQHWDFLDCIYRTDPKTNQPLYNSDQEIFGEIHPAESYLIDVIAAQMAQLPACNRLFTPLTLGNHVDHQLTRQAAERMFSPKTLHYYEDYPYARQYSAEQFITQESSTWLKGIIELSEHGIAARIRAIICFQSQLSSFFIDEADLEKQVRTFIETTGGEKIFTRLQD